MASITKLPSGAYRVQVRRKGRYASETFLRRDDAQKWARQAETLVDQGLPPNRSSVARLHTFGDLVDLHIADMCAVGKPPRRNKAAKLATLKRDLGKEKIGHLDRHKLIEYVRRNAAEVKALLEDQIAAGGDAAETLARVGPVLLRLVTSVRAVAACADDALRNFLSLFAAENPERKPAS
jgi:hypothetical protein